MATAPSPGFTRDQRPAPVPIWREGLAGLDWLALRTSSVFYGCGVPRGDGSAAVLVPGFRVEEGFDTLAVVDAFGRGSACITWAPAHLRGGGARLRAIDLTGDVKPYLMTSAKNNLGLETRIAYAPSTKPACT